MGLWTDALAWEHPAIHLVLCRSQEATSRRWIACQGRSLCVYVWISNNNCMFVVWMDVRTHCVVLLRTASSTSKLRSKTYLNYGDKNWRQLENKVTKNFYNIKYSENLPQQQHSMRSKVDDDTKFSEKRWRQIWTIATILGYGDMRCHMFELWRQEFRATLNYYDKIWRHV